MEIADTDGSGTIDFEEFKELVGKLEYTMEEDALKEMFSAQDGDESGELDKAAFGSAIYSVLNANKDDEPKAASDDDEEQ